MNILELDSLNTMLGKAVEIDGCCVGHLAGMTLEQTIRKMDEYSKIMCVLADKNC